MADGKMGRGGTYGVNDGGGEGLWVGFGHEEGDGGLSVDEG